jgi:methyl-accepting chemotaxis protein
MKVTITTMDNRRQIKNFVIDSKALLRLSIPFFILLISNLIITFLVCHETSRSLEEIAADDLKTAAMIVQLSNTILFTLVSGITVLGVLSFLLWVVFSHRVFGPAVPIRRHIKKLIEGNYADSIKLRKYDEFKEVAEDLNQLTEALREKHHA